jgi:hypothetical protein
MDFGNMFVILHQVRRGDVLKTQLGTLDDELDSCITILWNATKPDVRQVECGLAFADETVRNIELATGRTCSIPLTRQQLPTTFGLGWFDVASNTMRKVLVQGKGERPPKITTDLTLKLFALGGFDEKYNEMMRHPPYSSISMSARWQQKAIRALGNNEWADCILACSVWIETFVVQMTVAINELLGSPIPDTRSALARGLPQFINTHLGSKHLKGRWDHTLEDTEFGRWYLRCYEKRNAIVHTGALPAPEDATVAYDAAHAFIRFLTKKMAKLEDKRLDQFLVLLRAMSKDIK